MNIVKLGVSLRRIHSFETILPPNMVKQVYCINGAIVMRIFGYDSLLALKVVWKNTQSQDSQTLGNKADLSFDGIDLPRIYSVKSSEEVLCLQYTEFETLLLEDDPMNG